MMLRRQSYMTKKKEKKLELEKTQQLIQSVIEKNLNEQCAKTDLNKSFEELLPNFTLTLSEKDSTMIQHFIGDLAQYVAIANKYSHFK